MALPDRLHNAVKSLTAALDLLDAAIERRDQADAVRADLEHELALVQEDRSRLADALDASLDRADRLSTATRAVHGRLDRMGALCAGLTAEPASAAAES